MPQNNPNRRLDDFMGVGYVKGRPVPIQALWFATSKLVVEAWWLPMTARGMILRAFGAKIGQGCRIKHGVKIHWPWKLFVGDNTWIGEGAHILNLEDVRLGSNVCVSQDALLCTGSHAIDSPTFEFANAPIEVQDHAWICARAIVLPGTVVGAGAVVSAGATARGRVADAAVERARS